MVRRWGTAFAVVQLGTIFAATRALRTDRLRQRRVVLDLRRAPALGTVVLFYHQPHETLLPTSASP